LNNISNVKMTFAKLSADSDLCTYILNARILLHLIKRRDNVISKEMFITLTFHNALSQQRSTNK
jgi:DNA-binding winged helix-turn-helix (wHTH) protein